MNSDKQLDVIIGVLIAVGGVVIASEVLGQPFGGSEGIALLQYLIYGAIVLVGLLVAVFGRGIF